MALMQQQPAWMCLYCPRILVILILPRHHFASPTSLSNQKFSPQMLQLQSPSPNASRRLSMAAFWA